MGSGCVRSVVWMLGLTETSRGQLFQLLLRCKKSPVAALQERCMYDVGYTDIKIKSHNADVTNKKLKIKN